MQYKKPYFGVMDDDHPVVKGVLAAAKRISLPGPDDPDELDPVHVPHEWKDEPVPVSSNGQKPDGDIDAHNYAQRETPQDLSAWEGVESRTRGDILDEAKTLITEDRNAAYGPPTQDFTRISDVLNAYGYRRIAHGEHGPMPEYIQPSDVAIIQIALKLSRLMHSRTKRDNWVDVAGYAACGWECSEVADG